MIGITLRRAYTKAKRIVKRLAKTSSAHSQPIQKFRYRKPEPRADSVKEIALLCKQDTMRGAVHVIRRGGEEHLHSHQKIDGLWMVLKGKVRFHGDEGVVIGDFGPLEGVLVPRRTRYWFESIGDEELEMLQVLAFDRGKGFDRHDHAKPNFSRSNIKWIDCRVESEPGQ